MPNLHRQYIKFCGISYTAYMRWSRSTVTDTSIFPPYLPPFLFPHLSSPPFFHPSFLSIIIIIEIGVYLYLIWMVPNTSVCSIFLLHLPQRWGYRYIHGPVHSLPFNTHAIKKSQFTGTYYNVVMWDTVFPLLFRS